jgi:D-alanyl-D-alanine carboxypeptidase
VWYLLVSASRIACVLPALLAGLLTLLAPSQVQAKPLLLFDAATGEVILEHEAGEKWYPASLTKLMTAYLTFESLAAGRLKLDTKIRVPAGAEKIPPSKLGLKPGSTVSVDLALKAMLVHSANDMALTLAEAQGGQAAFVNRMNQTAQRLGMASTRFTNPHGLFDEAQISTARDLGLLASALLKQFPQHARYYGAPFVEVGKKKLRNRNLLLRQMKDADGMKTGFVCPSGFNLVATASRNGRRLVAVILGQRTAVGRADAAQALLELGFSTASGSRAQRLAAIAPVAAGPENLREAVCKTPVKAVDPMRLTGWGVSFGRHKGVVKSEAAIASTVAVTGGALEKVSAGLVRVPQSKTDFLALAWGLEQQHTTQLCGYLKALNRYCETIAPEQLAALRAIAAREATPEPAGDRRQKRAVADPEVGE